MSALYFAYARITQQNKYSYKLQLLNFYDTWNKYQRS